MKLIVDYRGRYLDSLMTGLALAVTVFAKSDNRAELPELIDREKEIEMALSAAPEYLRKDFDNLFY